MFDHLPGGPGDIWLRGHKRIAGRVAAWNSSWELQVLVSLREAGETNLKLVAERLEVLTGQPTRWDATSDGIECSYW